VIVRDIMTSDTKELFLIYDNKGQTVNRIIGFSTRSSYAVRVKFSYQGYVEELVDTDESDATSVDKDTDDEEYENHTDGE